MQNNKNVVHSLFKMCELVLKYYICSFVYPDVNISNFLWKGKVRIYYSIVLTCM